MEKMKVALLGSTGSIGCQALEVLRTVPCEIVLMAGGRNLPLLARQASEFSPGIVATTYGELEGALRAMIPQTMIKTCGGEKALKEALMASGADVVIHSIAGLAGLPYALCASEMGVRLAMANKEAIVAGGNLIREALEKCGGELIPVDSEHSAIFQCLQTAGPFRCLPKEPHPELSRILLTASGGPFFGMKREDLKKVSPSEALAHPTWKMGGKITIDSATLMNKGFEVLEASALFAARKEQIEVLVHRQSIVHSMVEFRDGDVIAQLGLPDMRSCIRYALSYPKREKTSAERLDLLKVGSLTFEKPDTETFPLLRLAFDVMDLPSGARTALIASDEVAVDAFLRGKISFSQISDTVEEAMGKMNFTNVTTEEEIRETDREARRSARTLTES